MSFDACVHQIRQLAIRAAIEIRKIKGLSEEKNITVLFNEVAPILGIAPIMLSSKEANHLPSPHEMKKEEGGFVLPRKDCPECDTKGTMILEGLCQSCEDAEGGKYKTVWHCQECGQKEKSPKHFIQWLNDLGIELPRGGLHRGTDFKTLTDNGVR